MKCKLCGNEIHGYGNNGAPLVEGQVCNDCNWKVIKERLKLSRESERKEEQPATESVEVIGTGGPVNVTKPMEDFERYAKEFEETFILGKTPVRKEKAENKTKVKNGVIEGEVVSMEKKEEEIGQVEPVQSATESLKVGDKVRLDDYRRDSKSGTIKNIFSGAPGATSYKIRWDDGTESVEIKSMVKSSTEALHGCNEITEFFKLCKEIGITDMSWLQRFIEENPGDPLASLKAYRSELGEDFEITDQKDEALDEAAATEI